jgi:hypothetical protein
MVSLPASCISIVLSQQNWSKHPGLISSSLWKRTGTPVPSQPGQVFRPFGVKTYSLVVRSREKVPEGTEPRESSQRGQGSG